MSRRANKEVTSQQASLFPLQLQYSLTDISRHRLNCQDVEQKKKAFAAIQVDVWS